MRVSAPGAAMAASSLQLIPHSGAPRLHPTIRLPPPTASAASPKPRDLPFSTSTLSLPPASRIPRLACHQPPTQHPPLFMPTGSVTTQQRHQQQQQQQQLRHKTVLVENFHQHRKLGGLLGKLTVTGCSPLQLLEEDDDGWNNDEFWAVVNFLRENGRVAVALQMFDAWTKREPSHATDGNYSRIVRLLSEEGLVEGAASVLREMVDRGLKPSVAVFNSVVHGYAKEGDFDGASGAIWRMGEMGLVPVAETYHGLIQAYGKRRMYDEMSKSVRRMVSDGCPPNEVTYNMLIVEYARGRLLERMEGTYRTVRSKRMNLLASTLVVMLETYAELGVLEKMEKVYQKSLSSKAYLKDSLIRKLALVYIENYRFSRLEEFANEIASRTGRTCLVCCLLLLSSALLFSRKGMESIVREMKDAKVSPHITFTNILALAHMKMKDFRDLESLLLSQVGASGSPKPDLVTVGILFDACSNGFDGNRVLDVWRRNRLLEQAVEMNTDPLVITAFGKGSFLRSCEELFSVVGRCKASEKKVWTYVDLIRCVFSSDGKVKVVSDSKLTIFK